MDLFLIDSADVDGLCLMQSQSVQQFVTSVDPYFQCSVRTIAVILVSLHSSTRVLQFL